MITENNNSNNDDQPAPVADTPTVSASLTQSSAQLVDGKVVKEKRSRVDANASEDYTSAIVMNNSNSNIDDKSRVSAKRTRRG